MNTLNPIVRRRPLTLCTLAIALICSGCGPSTNTPTPARRNTDAQEDRDYLIQAIVSLNEPYESDPPAVRGRIRLNLNRWMSEQTADETWTRDELLDRLPRRYRELPPLLPQHLKSLDFSAPDVIFLQELTWLRDITRWISNSASDTNFANLIEQAETLLDESAHGDFDRSSDKLATSIAILDKKLTVDDAKSLATCLRLFDWTIRNIQLDELLPRRLEETAGPQPTTGDGKSKPQVLLSEPGPGYQHFPWQILMYGHGDAWERARVFIHLARQLNIPVVMLGVDETGRTSRALPWLPAVFLNKQLYLFDTALGLPIPGPKGEAVATLEQILESPEMLRSLDVERKGDSTLAYPITEKELSQVVAMIDAAPEFLSRRMYMVEKQLAGQHKLVVTIRPSDLAQRIVECRGINQVGIWTLPFDTLRYRIGWGLRIASDPEARNKYFRTESIFDGLHPMVTGRRRHFQGILVGDEAERTTGAKALYLEARMSNDVLERIDKVLKQIKEDNRLLTGERDLYSEDQEFLARFGLGRNIEEDPARWLDRIAQFKVIFHLTKVHAGYWLALTHYESGNFGDAANWLKNAKETDTEGHWTHGIQYNMARSYEAMGEWSQARRLYLADDSPQEHGNRLRARMLDDRLAKKQGRN